MKNDLTKPLNAGVSNSYNSRNLNKLNVIVSMPTYHTRNATPIKSKKVMPMTQEEHDNLYSTNNRNTKVGHDGKPVLRSKRSASLDRISQPDSRTQRYITPLATNTVDVKM